MTDPKSLDLDALDALAAKATPAAKEAIFGACPSCTATLHLAPLPWARERAALIEEFRSVLPALSAELRAWRADRSHVLNWNGRQLSPKELKEENERLARERDGYKSESEILFKRAQRAEKARDAALRERDEARLDYRRTLGHALHLTSEATDWVACVGCESDAPGNSTCRDMGTPLCGPCRIGQAAEDLDGLLRDKKSDSFQVRAERAEADARALREGLRPFAEMGAKFSDDRTKDWDVFAISDRPNRDDWFRAAALLSPKPAQAAPAAEAISSVGKHLADEAPRHSDAKLDAIVDHVRRETRGTDPTLWRCTQCGTTGTSTSPVHRCAPPTCATCGGSGYVPAESQGLNLPCPSCRGGA